MARSAADPGRELTDAAAWQQAAERWADREIPKFHRW
jgi:hypothetical protein